MTIEPGSKWKRRSDGAEVTVRESFQVDGFLLGLMTLVEYSVVEPRWKDKGYASPLCVGTCQDKAWPEHFSPIT